MKKEKKFFGMVNFSTYTKFFNYGGFIYLFLCLSLFAISVGARIFADFWIGSWANEKYYLSDSEYIRYYVIIAFVALFFILLRGVLFADYMSRICFRVF